jgi:hypothetical protein
MPTPTPTATTGDTPATTSPSTSPAPFAAASRSSRRLRRPRAALLPLVAIAALAFVPAACSQSDSSSDSLTTAAAATESDADFEAATEDFAASETTVQAAASSGAQPEAGSAVVAGQNQIKTAAIAMRVDTAKFVAAVDAATVAVTGAGGYIETSSVTGGDLIGLNSEGVETRTQRSATMTMRVPNAKFDSARASIKALGEVASEEVTGEDVTSQLVDIEARLTSLRLQEDAYRRLFEAAVKIADIIEVQRELTNVRTQIEQITAQQKALSGRVSMSIISVQLAELRPLDAAAALPPKKKTFGERAGDTWNNAFGALANLGEGLALAGIALVPFLPFPLVGGLLLRWVIRRSSRPITLQNPLQNPLQNTVPASPPTGPSDQPPAT